MAHMGCFSCFALRSGRKAEQRSSSFKHHKKKGDLKSSSSSTTSAGRESSSKDKNGAGGEGKRSRSGNRDRALVDSVPIPTGAQPFTYKELMIATRNFRSDCLIGEGGFGRVYKARLESSGLIVAVKQLDRNGLQGNREFRVEVAMLSRLYHPNLVNLIGYCADGEQRLLVYEYMPLGSLEDHLFDLPPEKESLDWIMRMKIAAGAAMGLEYLHDKANPPVIYRDFKSSNILLDENYHPKLSDFGLARMGPEGDKTHVSTRVMGTYGYCAPEYAMTGQLTLKSDVYSFGVVLLELITGRKVIDNSRPAGEHNLIAWARPLFRDRRKFPLMADPLLNGRFPMRGLYHALGVASMCLQEQGQYRPLISDIVSTLTFLASLKSDAPSQSPVPMPKLLLPQDREGKRLGDVGEKSLERERDREGAKDGAREGRFRPRSPVRDGELKARGRSKSPRPTSSDTVKERDKERTREREGRARRVKEVPERHNYRDGSVVGSKAVSNTDAGVENAGLPGPARELDVELEWERERERFLERQAEKEKERERERERIARQASARSQAGANLIELSEKAAARSRHGSRRVYARDRTGWGEGWQDRRRSPTVTVGGDGIG